MLNSGIVIKSTGSEYLILTEGQQQFICRLKGKFRLEGVKSTNPIAVGDKVKFSADEAQIGQIEEIIPRENYVIRKSTNLSKQVHIVAANVDQAVLVVTLKSPKTSLEFIDRYLVSVEAYHIPAVILFNKIDLLDNQEREQLQQVVAIYKAIGYKVLMSSVKDATGMDEVSQLFNQKTSLISGNSGVGKSSLIQAMVPTADRKVDVVSTYHQKGKHTTTFAEMITINQGSYLIDTPGLKAFGLVDIAQEELYHFFPEIFEHAANCKFHNCVHINEPGCAVITAVNNQQISEQRYISYLKIYEDEASKYR